MKLLRDERKMTDGARNLLDDCAAKIEEGGVDCETLAKVKACGLCSNIAKHVID